jgi:hypothetical protein
LGAGFGCVGRRWVLPDGAATIANARFDYNEAIVRSFDNQMLLNLVRLRYQDAKRLLVARCDGIEDTDLESKSTYALLAQLFSLQSASGNMPTPVLTIPTR